MEKTIEAGNANISLEKQDTASAINEEIPTSLSFSQKPSSTDILSSTDEDEPITHSQFMEQKIKELKHVENNKESKKTPEELEENTTNNSETKKETTLKTETKKLVEVQEIDAKNPIIIADDEKKKKNGTKRSTSVKRSKSPKSENSVKFINNKKVFNWLVYGFCRNLNSLVEFLKAVKDKTDMIISSYQYNPEVGLDQIKVFLKFKQGKDYSFFNFMPVVGMQVCHAGKSYVTEREDVESTGKPLYKYYGGMEYDIYTKVKEMDKEDERKRAENEIKSELTVDIEKKKDEKENILKESVEELKKLEEKRNESEECVEEPNSSESRKYIEEAYLRAKKLKAKERPPQTRNRVKQESKERRLAMNIYKILKEYEEEMN